MNQDNSKFLTLAMISRYVLVVGFILAAANYTSGKPWECIQEYGNEAER